MPFDAILEANKTKDWLANPINAIQESIGRLIKAVEDLGPLDIVKNYNLALAQVSTSNQTSFAIG